MTRTDTAHLTWDKRWKTKKGREHWLIPEPEVVDTLAWLESRGVRTVLDLGCGVGRHSLLFAKAGFRVHAADGSPSGIRILKKSTETLELGIGLCRAEMTRLPFGKESMDYVLGWNVIYHGDQTVVRQVISEILRVLKPGGLYQGTMLSKRNKELLSGRCVAENTYINEDSPEKNHPHYLCNAPEILRLFQGFDIWSLKDRKSGPEKLYHWHLLAEKS